MMTFSMTFTDHYHFGDGIINALCPHQTGARHNIIQTARWYALKYTKLACFPLPLESAVHLHSRVCSGVSYASVIQSLRLIKFIKQPIK